MKNQLMKLCLMAFVAVSIFACSNDDDSGNNNPAAEGSLIATINGDEFNATVQVGATLFNDIFNIVAINPSTGESITITVSEASVGTFDLSSAGNLQNGAAYTIEGENAYVSVGEGGNGSITITSLDVENMTTSGTFSFTGVRETFDVDGNIVIETAEINNGAFNNIPLATEVGGNANNSFSADVDGSALDADSVTAFEITFNNETFVTVSAINNATNQNITLKFPDDISTGSYDLTSSFSADYQATYNPELGGATNNYYSNTGTLTITSVNSSTGVIEGTFNFMAKRLDPNDPDVTYEVTNGEFSLEI